MVTANWRSFVLTMLPTCGILALVLHGASLTACATAPCEVYEADSLPSFNGRAAIVDTTHPGSWHVARILLVDVYHTRWGDVNPYYPERPLPETIIVHVTDRTTVLLRQRDGTLACAGSSMPSVGDTIDAWSSGVELRSGILQYYLIRLEMPGP